MEDTTKKYNNEPDINDLARRFKEILMELESKRKLLKDNDIELQSIKSEKSFLQQELEKVQHEKNYVQKQLDEMKRISRQREEEWSNFRDSWAQNKIKFEIANKSSDSLKMQISTQQQEISKLKTEKEELERQMRDNLLWKEKCVLTQKRVESTMELLNRQMHSLEQDQIRLNTTTKAALIMANTTVQFKNNYEKLIKHLTEENLEMKKKVVQLAMQLEELKFTPKLKNVVNEKQNHTDLIKTIDEWTNYQDERYKETNKHFERMRKMYESITKLQASEAEATTTIKNLEEELEEEKMKNKNYLQQCQKNNNDDKTETKTELSEVTMETNDSIKESKMNNTRKTQQQL